MNKVPKESSDHIFMQEALELAQQAATENEVPIGAIVVDAQGTVIGRGANKVEQCKSQLAHAELLAIAQASKTIGDWRLDGCTIYVTLEPCTMCFGCIRLSRLARLVYAAQSPRFGYQLDNIVTGGVYKKDIKIDSGIGEGQAQQLVKQFFQKQRKKKGEYKD
jgi:tRNA(adenine34) deaminase